MSESATCFDIAIVGAGPAGLCMAVALADTGLSVAVVDPAPDSVLAEPPFDGREIALTHASKCFLERLGIWALLDPAEISPLRDAWVFDGNDPKPMRISHRDGGADQLGYLVPNHRIRACAFEAFRQLDAGSLFSDRRVTGVERGPEGAGLHLDDGRVLTARLVIAADGRFSSTRRAFGIAARQRDFGRSMLVCRMALEQDHQHVAWEWFGRDQTLALLPLNGTQASVVITLPHAEIQRLERLDPAAFNQEVSARYQRRLGVMQLASQRCVYPLIGVWPDRLVSVGFAAIGDAAVGMHPVTAHGFNLGLLSIEALARRIEAASCSGADFANAHLLQAYQREHRRHSLPLYLATGAIVGLYTSTSLPGRLLRRAALRSASRLPPFRRLIARSLTDRRADRRADSRV